MANPDFSYQERVGDDTVAEGSEELGDEGEGADEMGSGAEQGASADSGADTSEADGDEGTDTADTDQPPPECPVIAEQPFDFVYSAGVPGFEPEPCASFELQYVLTQVADLSLEPGVLEGQRCQNPDCTGCGEVEIKFGSTNLGPFVDYLELIPIVLAGQNMTELCFEIEGKTVIDADDDYCYYEAAALSLNQPDNGPIFVGSNSESPQTLLGEQVFANAEPPTILDTAAECPCEDYFYPDADTCCAADDSSARNYAVEAFGEPVLPGGDLDVEIGTDPWIFLLGQAQEIPSCGGPPEESLSWAMVRLPNP